MLHCFEFSGHGNYSDTHNWDMGMSSNISKNPISNAKCIEDYWEYGVTSPLEKGVYSSSVNEYGGSRNVHGVVVAATKSEAIQMLQEFDSNWEVAEYEQPEW